MNLLDRLIVTAYVRSFLFCLASLLSLYVVIDLFTNLDDFFLNGQSFWKGLRGIWQYYLYSSSRIFDRLCEPIVLLAAAFTVSWMQRNNEMLPLLSAGVPTRRVLRPVLIGAMFLLALGIANQELIIPKIAHRLTRPRDDMDGERETWAQANYDSTGIHLEGHAARPIDQSVSHLHCTIPDAQGSGLVHLSATEARYVPPGAGPFTGGWLLNGVTPPVLPDWDNTRLARMIDPGRWFVYTRDVDFNAMTRNGTWYMLFSTSDLNDYLHRTDSRRLDGVAVVFHMRLARPVIGFLLVVMGLAVILRDPNRNMYLSAGLCLVICGVFFIAVYGCKFLGDNDLLTPPLAAWLPVLVFGPVALVMFDAMHT